MFSRLVVRANFCSPHLGVDVVTSDGAVTNRWFVDEEDPSKAFKAILTLIPHSIDTHVKTLVLAAGSLNSRLIYATQGVRLGTPTLDACTVKAYLSRFIHVRALEVEDVRWVDCPGSRGRCQCLSTLEPVPYRTLAFHRVSHFRCGSLAPALISVASSLNSLVIDSVTYQGCYHIPSDTVPIAAFTWSINRQPWGNGLPRFRRSCLRRLDLSPITSKELPHVRRLLFEQRESLEEISLRIWWCGDRESCHCEPGALLKT